MFLDEPLIFERGASGRRGWRLPAEEVDLGAVPPLPAELEREELSGLPEVSEPELVRHFVRLSQWNYSPATTFYPLGSCTMKYNPALNDLVAGMPGFTRLHPLLPEELAQGALRVMKALEEALAEIGGLDAVSLQPAAGAQGELVGIKMIRAYHAARGDPRRKVLVPASAHGTNPASCALCGYEVVEVPVSEAGTLTSASVERLTDRDTAALMVTNPNTLGLFEVDILAVSEVVHRAGGLVYMDGANLNALMGVAKPGHMGVDVLHFNLHKTFSTPHGGGGPGAGPVAVRAPLAPYLPVPRLVRDGEMLRWSEDFPLSVGRVRSFYGNFAVLVRALAYIRSMGGPGLAWATAMAIMNANYLRSLLAQDLHLPFSGPSMHECVFSDQTLRGTGVRTLDVAKRLLDYGFHAPTIYFPLVVSGALMIEPTESESPETLEMFAAALRQIIHEARTQPEVVKMAPHRTPVARLDETRAARHPVLRWDSGGTPGRTGPRGPQSSSTPR